MKQASKLSLLVAVLPVGLYLETYVSIETFCEKWSLFGLYFEVKSLNLKIGQKSWKSDQNES